MTFAEWVHLLGTPVLVGLYILRLFILLKARPAGDLARPRGRMSRGVLLSYLTIFMPWSMESTRTGWTRYVEFFFFHMGVFSNILLSFLIPYAPGILTSPLRWFFLVAILAAILAGAVRLGRRILVANNRLISTPDDYFSLGLILLFLGFGVPALLGSTAALFGYYIVSFFFLIYEPFSKIRHYIYFPFTRYYYGAQQGKRGFTETRYPDTSSK
jgi:hypothetical protein